MTPAERAAQASAFLAAAGWGGAARAPLAGDASARRYERLRDGPRLAVLMDSPPEGKGDDPAEFVRIARHLRGLGLSAPEILAEDLAQGFLLLEDLGDGLVAALLAESPAREAELLRPAVGVLAELQRHAAPAGLPDLSAGDWAEAAMLAFDWYPGLLGAEAPPGARAEAGAALAEALARHADGPRVLILRDYHAGNLIWLPDRAGLAHIGLLDFQLAQMGQPVYDLVSLVQDARRDVAAEVAAGLIRDFAAATGTAGEALLTALAAFGAQRALRILGIFARLACRDGKTGYLVHLPRVWGQLQTNLAHPALAPLARALDGALPAPQGLAR